MVYTTLSTTPAISDELVGVGVDIAEVVHTRDEFLDKYLRSENGRQYFYQALADTVSEIETIFQEMEGEEFQYALNDFQQACEEIAKDPSDSVNQNLIIQKATLFLSRAQAVRESLTTYQENMNKQVQDIIYTINDIGHQITELNKAIAKVEAGNVETAYDMRDERDNLLDELSQYVKITYSEVNDHTLTIQIEGTEFVDGKKCYELDAYADPVTGYINPTWSHLTDYNKGDIKYLYDLTKSCDTNRNTDIGSLKSLLIARGDKQANYLDSFSDTLSALGIDTGSDLTNESLMVNVESRLDTLVHSIVTNINEIFSPTRELTNAEADMVYENGIYIFRARATNGAMVTFRSTEPIRVWDEENGSLGADKTGPGEELFTRLFEDRYTQVNYRGKTYYVLNPEDYSDTATTYTMTNVEVNPKLAQDCTKLPYQFANGDVDMTMGLALSSVWTTGMDELGGKTFVEYYNYLINDVADLGSVYQGKADTLTTTVESLENKRQEVIGVSSDEELSNLIRYQSAYNASSRFITVMSEMIETLVTQL